MRADKMKIKAIANNYRLYAANSLEEYRCDSFFTKEPETIEWIRQIVVDGEVFYDVGANIGIYSIFTAILYPKCRVYCFEPYWKNYQRLCENIKLNRVENIVPLFIGLSANTCIDSFYIKDERLGASGSQFGSNVDEHGDEYKVLSEEKVLVFSLDQFIDILHAPAPNHIKIDVDGRESEIVAGMRKLITNPQLKSVLIEINRDTVNPDPILKLLLKQGFSIDHPLNSLSNHSRYRRRGTISENTENVIFFRIS